MDELQASLEIEATEGHTDAVTGLLQAGAPVGDSLHNSIVSGHVETAAELLRHGVSLVAKDRLYNLTPMQLVANHVPAGKVKAVVDLLVAHGACIEGTVSPSPLYLSVVPGNLSTAFALLAAGADVASKLNGDTPVHRAACTGCVDILIAMLGSRPDGVKFTDRTCSTALHHACSRNHSDVVNVLVDASADLEARDTFGHTPLVVAAAEGAFSAAAVMVKRGADINAVNGFEQTALACAAQNAGLKGAVDIVQLLLRYVADETKQDKNGRTALDVVGSWIGGGWFARGDNYGRTHADDRMPLGCIYDDIDRVRALLHSAPRDRAWRRRGCVVMIRSAFVSSSIIRLAVAQGGQTSTWAGASAWLLGAPVEIFREIVRFL